MYIIICSKWFVSSLDPFDQDGNFIINGSEKETTDPKNLKIISIYGDYCFPSNFFVGL
ncbi:hypothetical protein Hanom_Chr17g01588331 [Helianthus anomalus]